MKLNHMTDEKLKLQYEFERLTEELNKAKLKLSECNDLMNAK